MTEMDRASAGDKLREPGTGRLGVKKRKWCFCFSSNTVVARVRVGLVLPSLIGTGKLGGNLSSLQ